MGEKSPDSLVIKKMQELKLSEHGYLKREIFNIHVKGGLKKWDKTQKIVGSYYASTEKHSPKIVINFGLASESRDEFEETPSSLRFDSYDQLQAFIFHLLRCNAMLGKLTGKITSTNFNARLKKAKDIVEAHYRSAGI
jgi:hypothetical protein